MISAASSRRWRTEPGMLLLWGMDGCEAWAFLLATGWPIPPLLVGLQLILVYTSGAALAQVGMCMGRSAMRKVDDYADVAMELEGSVNSHRLGLPASAGGFYGGEQLAAQALTALDPRVEPADANGRRVSA